MPLPVVSAQIDHLQLEATVGGYAAAAQAGCTYPAASGRVAAVYSSVAKLIGADAEEIALVENATVGWMMAFYAVANSFKPGDRILTAACEVPACSLAPFVSLARPQARRLCVPSTSCSDHPPSPLPAAQYAANYVAYMQVCRRTGAVRHPALI